MSEIDIRRIVAETLRMAALWMSEQCEEERDLLRRFADDVERMRADDACCALCEEVDCDEDCPMREWREADQVTTGEPLGPEQATRIYLRNLRASTSNPKVLAVADEIEAELDAGESA